MNKFIVIQDASRPLMYQRFPSASCVAAERFEFFTDLVNQLFSPSQCNTFKPQRANFRFHLEAADLGRVKLANVATDALLVERRAQHIGAIANASMLVKFQMSGESVFNQRGRTAHLRPGDFVICSNAEPYRLSFKGPYEMSVVAIEQGQLQWLQRPMTQLLGQRMPGDDPSCSLLSGFVSMVTQRLHQLPEAMAERAENNILDLLGGVISTRANQQSGARQPASQTLLEIKQYIADNLSDRRLCPLAIAKAFGVSTRYLHKLFSSEPETVTRFIRSQRLEASRQMLQSKDAATMSITEIAMHWGFYDLSHMTHAFSERFGVCPSEMRMQTPQLPEPGTDCANQAASTNRLRP